MQGPQGHAFGQVAWIIASSHRAEESPLVGVAMSEHRWGDFLRRGFFPCVPCAAVSFARIQLSAQETDQSSFDILLHKVGHCYYLSSCWQVFWFRQNSMQALEC